MAKKTKVEKVIRILREVEVLQGQGLTIAEAVRKVGVSAQMYYRRKKEFGRLDVVRTIRGRVKQDQRRIEKLAFRGVMPV